MMNQATFLFIQPHLAYQSVYFIFQCSLLNYIYFQVYNIITDEVVREIGKGENIRFLGVALCRAVPNASEKLQGAATSFDVEAAENPNLKAGEPDPMIVSC